MEELTGGVVGVIKRFDPHEGCGAQKLSLRLWTIAHPRGQPVLYP